MAEPIKTTRRGRIWPAIDPKTGKASLEVLIPQRRARWAHRCGIGAIKELAYHVTRVLVQPKKIYEGIRKETDEERFSGSDGWLCYCANPGTRFDHETGTERPSENRVLLVFVNKDGENYNHRWEEEDPYCPGVPKDLEDRFSREAL